MNIPIIPKNINIRETELSRDTKTKKSPETFTTKDKVSIGADSKLASRLVEKLKKTQTTEKTGIEELKKQIDAGTYNPSSNDIAKAILSKIPEF